MLKHQLLQAGRGTLMYEGDFNTFYGEEPGDGDGLTSDDGEGLGLGETWLSGVGLGEGLADGDGETLGLGLTEGTTGPAKFDIR